MLLLVPVLQVLHEKMSGERVQALDMVEDTFVTPARKMVQVSNDLQKILSSCSKIEATGKDTGEETDLYGTAEELLSDAEAARAHFLECNRHITDSLRGEKDDFDSLLVIIRTLRNAVDDEDNQALLAAVNACSAHASKLRAMVAPCGIGPSIRRVFNAFFTTTVFNNHYIRAYEKELEDRSVVAQTVRPLMQFMRYTLLADVGEKAIRGNDRWLFYRPDVEYCYRPSVFNWRSQVTDYNDMPLTENPLLAITDFRDQLALRNIDLLVVVVPGKPSIYPDKLCGSLGDKAGTGVSPTGQFLDSLHAHGIETVDLFGPFRKERNNDEVAGEKMYLSTDTHWKYRGLRCAAEMVAGRIRAYNWYGAHHVTEEYLLDTVVTNREGDIGVMTDLPNNKFERLRIPFALEPTRCCKVYTSVRDSNGTLRRGSLYRDDYKNSRILLLGDSFSRIYQTDAPGSAGFVAHLAASISEPMASLVSDGGASTLVREKLVRNSGLLKNKRLVVWEFVERDIRFGAFGWKKVQLP